jgi:hypothetical protein
VRLELEREDRRRRRGEVFVRYHEQQRAGLRQLRERERHGRREHLFEQRWRRRDGNGRHEQQRIDQHRQRQ